MGYTKDLWTAPDPNDPEKRIPNTRWGKGKRWLSCWTDADGNTPTKAFANQKAATKHWVKMEADVERGEYQDPKAKTTTDTVDVVAQRWLKSRDVDPSTLERDESLYRVHIEPFFADRAAASVKPSEIQERLTAVARSRSRSTRDSVKRVLNGIFELANADEPLPKGNPVQSKVVKAPKRQVKAITEVWDDDTAWKIIDNHPQWLRILPELGETSGLREGELFGLAVGDIDGDTLHVRRQIKRAKGGYVFALPKNDTERDVPLSQWSTQCIDVHLTRVSPLEVTLPWETIDGPLVTHQVLIPHLRGHMTAQRLNPVWGAALHRAGLIGPPVSNHGLHYPVGKEFGRHAMRHYYASLQLSEGTTITALAAYLGHHDPAFTFRMYGKLQPDSHERARDAIDRRFFRPRAV